MSAAARDYFTALAGHLDRLAAEQAGQVEAAADLFADVIAGRGVVHLHDTGHMIGYEFVARTGGFLAFERLAWQAAVARSAVARTPQVTAADEAQSVATLVGWVLGQAGVRPGDALVLSSVSGVSVSVVELALQARDRGIPVIALTSTGFSAQLAARHPSGQRLLDVATVVLDNLAPYGDAMVAMPGLDEPVCPVSGLAGTALLWAAVAAAAERLLARGVVPSVYPSVNLPDGPERVARLEARFRERRQ